MNLHCDTIEILQHGCLKSSLSSSYLFQNQRMQQQQTKQSKSKKNINNLIGNECKRLPGIHAHDWQPSDPCSPSTYLPLHVIIHNLVPVQSVWVAGFCT